MGLSLRASLCKRGVWELERAGLGGRVHCSHPSGARTLEGPWLLSTCPWTIPAQAFFRYTVQGTVTLEEEVKTASVLKV